MFFAAIAAFVVGRFGGDRQVALPPPPEFPALPPPKAPESRDRRGGIIIDVTDASRQAHAKRMEHARRLEREYAPLPHYDSDEWITKYAKWNLDTLLDEREEIIGAWQALNEDVMLVEILRAQSPETYARMAWQVRALAEAEKAMVSPPEEPTPQTPPVSKEEARLAEVTRTIAEQARLAIATAEAILDAKNALRTRLTAQGMPPDEIERLADEMEQTISASITSKTKTPENRGSFERY